MKLNTTDVTTSVSVKFEKIDIVSNITKFNTDPFSTWRSAFRECAKLSSKIIDRNYDHENDVRLEIWCSRGLDQPYGNYCIAGANEGKKYGESNIGNNESLEKINDYAWLEEQYRKWQINNDR